MKKIIIFLLIVLFFLTSASETEPIHPPIISDSPAIRAPYPANRNTINIFQKLPKGYWDEFLYNNRKMTSLEKLENTQTYVHEKVAYRWEYNTSIWQSAEFTLTNHYGDCEDFAIAKYQLLSKLGISEKDMYISVGYIFNDPKRGHAVLLVRLSNGYYVLDNNLEKVQPQDNVKYFTPIFSFGDKQTMWIHGSLTGMKTQTQKSPS